MHFSFKYITSPFLLISVLFIICSCNNSDVLPSSSGKAGELVVVIDSSYWKTNSAVVLHDSLTAEYPALPQYEPYFTVVNIHPSNFKSILELHRNVLIVEVGPLSDEKKYSLTMKNNVWSKPQLVMNLRVVDLNFLPDAIISYASTIRSKFTQEELTRSLVSLQSQNELQVSRDLKELTGVWLPLHEDYFIANSSNNYCWIRKETIHSSMGFQVLRFPYINKEDFTKERMIAIRDSVSKIHIPGPSEGSYMISDSNFVPLYQQIELAGNYATQIRGLWRTHGDFMGGPFISYLINDEKNGDLIFIDGYVYAPKFEKRDYIKSIESIVHSAKLD